MKSTLFILLFMATTCAIQAQIQVSTQAIQADDIPAAVISSQATYFPGQSVTIWEKQTAQGQNTTGDRFIANFNNDGKVVRAKYYPNGTGSVAVTYYSNTQLPVDIQEAVATSYSDYNLGSGEKILSLPTSDIYYRLRLRKGGQKLVVYGDELTIDDLPQDLTVEK